MNVPYFDVANNQHEDPVFPVRDLQSEELDVLYQNRAAGKPLVLSFGGMGQDATTHEAMYGWNHLIYEFPQYTHISVRDSYACWYFNGVRGLSFDIGTTVAQLWTIVKLLNPPVTVACGTSAGGFASILFGVLLEFDHVLALAPQTFLQNGIKAQCDHRLPWVEEALKLRPHDEAYRDLKNLTNTSTDIEIVYSKEEPVDTWHAERMAGQTGVRYTLSAGTHGEVAKHFRNSGEIKNRLEAYV